MMVKTEAKIIISTTLGVLLFGAISSAMIKNSTPPNIPEDVLGSYACTTDAKLCPDGSYVGRIPPYCQFATCPN
jgi:hypothetical protein